MDVLGAIHHNVLRLSWKDCWTENISPSIMFDHCNVIAVLGNLLHFPNLIFEGIFKHSPYFSPTFWGKSQLPALRSQWKGRNEICLDICWQCARVHQLLIYGMVIPPLKAPKPPTRTIHSKEPSIPPALWQLSLEPNGTPPMRRNKLLLRDH